MSGREGVEKLRVLLAPEKVWTKGALARDTNGTPVAFADPTATCFCTIGGLLKVTGGGAGYGASMGLIMRQLDHEGRFTTVPEFNDALRTDHADVLAFLDRVLA